eukprot:COSAG01_NODE_1646_length_9634_cov_27.152805_2_plen_70_part_00
MTKKASVEALRAMLLPEFAQYVERALEKRKMQEAMMAEAKKALKVLQKARAVGIVTTLSKDGKQSIDLC